MEKMQLNEQDRRMAEHIRRQYINREEDRLEQLQKLDSRVKCPGRVAASLLGVAGALVMGAGMSLVMVRGNMTMGLTISIPGLLALLLAFPVYALITGGRKKKYAEEIMHLSNEIVNSEGEKR